jgi:hypothetical protein
MLNLCGIVTAILKMGTGRNFSISGINSGHHYLPTYQILMISDNVEFLPPIFYAVFWQPYWKWRPVEIFRCQESIRDIIIYPHMKWRWNQTMLNLCVLWWPFWKWWQVEIFQCRESIRDIIIYPHIKFWWYRTMLNFYAHILCRVLAVILKMADISKIWKDRIAPLMVTYHYVKFYVSIIIHVEVININVQNFNFPIGFYSNPNLLWTPQSMTLTPFTTKRKTLGPTRHIYLTPPSFMKFCPVVPEIWRG